MANLTRYRDHDSGKNCTDEDESRSRKHLAEIDSKTGYIANIEDIIRIHYPTLQGTTYLDHAGTTPYPNQLIDDYAADLKAHLFGNPHSGSSASQLSSRRIDELRVRVLHYIRADPDEFDVVFVANATAAIKLVADAFRDHDDKGFWFGYHHDAHTSIIGVRELAKLGNACMNDAEVDKFMSDHRRRPSEATTVLLAYPGQSNMTGQRYSLDWCRQINQNELSHENKQAYSLYDAAGLLSTSPLDLSETGSAPDFTVLSFYKMFGFPDLGALIVRKSSADILRRRKYFGGGTVDAVSVEVNGAWHAKKNHLHCSLEDGTLPFHSIIALDHAMMVHERIYGDISNISRHTKYLASEAYNKLDALYHANGRPLCKIYSGDPGASSQNNGPIITFNLLDGHGTWISNVEVEKLGIVKGIQFRVGGLCNPGGMARHLHFTADQIRQNYNAGYRCGGGADIFDNQPTGTIRISFGPSSSIEDVTCFIEFLEEFFLDLDLSGKVDEDRVDNLNPRKPSFVIDSMMCFPIKSCGGYTVPRHTNWTIYPKGLEFDREWCLVHQGTNIALSQKQYPQMALLKPSIDLHKRLLTITYAPPVERHTSNKNNDSGGDTSNSIINIDLDNFPAAEAVMAKPCKQQFRSQSSMICGESVIVYIYTSREISEFFSNVLGVSCTLARFPPDEMAQHRRVSIRRPAPSPESSPEREQVTTKYMGLKLSNESPILLVSRSSVNMLNADIQARSRAMATSDSDDSRKSRISNSDASRTRLVTNRNTTISADSFRANIVIAETGPTRFPYMEDHFEQVSIRGANFDVLGPCQRCQMICVDQSNGTRNQEPFSTLAKTRRKDGRVWFGMHLCLDGYEPLVVQVGDVVDVKYDLTAILC